MYQSRKIYSSIKVYTRNETRTILNTKVTNRIFDVKFIIFIETSSEEFTLIKRYFSCIKINGLFPISRLIVKVKGPHLLMLVEDLSVKNNLLTT